MNEVSVHLVTPSRIFGLPKDGYFIADDYYVKLHSFLIKESFAVTEWLREYSENNWFISQGGLAFDGNKFVFLDLFYDNHFINNKISTYHRCSVIGCRSFDDLMKYNIALCKSENTIDVNNW